MISWGESYNSANQETPWLDRLYRCFEHPNSSVTPEQVTEIMTLLLGVAVEDREELASSIMMKVLSKNN